MIVNYASLVNQSERELLKSYSILDLSYRYNRAIKQSFLINQGIDIEKQEEESEAKKNGGSNRNLIEQYTDADGRVITNLIEHETLFQESELLKMDENFKKALEEQLQKQLNKE